MRRSRRRERRNENQICREQRRASFLAPGGLDRKTDSRSQALRAVISRYERFKPARGWRGGTLALAETTSAAAPEFCTWQQARSPAEGWAGQFTPQQGALIANEHCAVPPARPAWSATTSASKAIIPVFTEIKLISSTAPFNGLGITPESARRGRVSRCGPHSASQNASPRPTLGNRCNAPGMRGACARPARARNPHCWPIPDARIG
jgi:hypothetical protein